MIGQWMKKCPICSRDLRFVGKDWWQCRENENPTGHFGVMIQNGQIHWGANSITGKGVDEIFDGPIQELPGHIERLMKLASFR